MGELGMIIFNSVIIFLAAITLIVGFVGFLRTRKTINPIRNEDILGKDTRRK